MSALMLSTASGTAPGGLVDAAALLHALGPRAGAVWAKFSPEEAKRLRAAMETVAADPVRTASPIRSPAPETENGLWQAFSALPTSVICAVLRAEPPAIIALILRRMDPSVSAAIIRHLPRALVLNALQKLIAPHPVRRAAMEAIEAELAEALKGLATEDNAGAEASAARIFDELEGAGVSEMLATLNTAVPGSAERIRTLMFGFEDLALLTPAGMQTFLARVDRAVLVRALKGEAGRVHTAILANLTQRAGEVLIEEIEMLGPMRKSDIAEARRTLSAFARRLVAEGEIRSAGGGDDMYELVD